MLMCKIEYSYLFVFSSYFMFRWIQTSCPRLSIDWGAGFRAPILTPYEVKSKNKFENSINIYFVIGNGCTSSNRMAKSLSNGFLLSK
jgi:diphthamide synthase subunit DPH2